MLKNRIVVLSMAAALALPLAACSGTSTTTSTDTTSSDTTTSAEATVDDELVGQWRGSVETTGESVYGTTGGSEQMLDVNLEEDGTCSVEPLAAHADLLSDEGTWVSDGTTVTLTLSDRTIELTLDGANKMSGTASDFDIDGFDTIDFDYYG